MLAFRSVDDVLDFAIKQEIEASRFYTEMAHRVENPALSQWFTELAREEQGHQAKLEAFKRGEQPFCLAKPVEDLRVSDYVVDVEPRVDMDYQQALILAMKKEKAAFKFYLQLAEMCNSPDVKRVFQILAQEEAQHKLRFEVEYDDSLE